MQKTILLTVTSLTEGSIHQIQTLIVLPCSNGQEQLQKKCIQFPKVGRELAVMLALTYIVRKKTGARRWKRDPQLFCPCMSKVHLRYRLWLEWQEDVISCL